MQVSIKQQDIKINSEDQDGNNKIFILLYIYIYIAELLINQILDNKIDKYIPILSNSKQPKFNQNPVNKKSMNKLFPSDPD